MPQDDISKGISDVLIKTGEPPDPPEQDHRAYGSMDSQRMGSETAAAIKTAAEAVIAEHYRAVEHLESLAKQSRVSVDAFAEKLRGYSEGFTGHLSEFFVFAQKSSDQAALIAAEFENKIAVMIPHKNGQGAAK